MKVTRLAEARPYEAKAHFAMTGLRLQGAEAGPCDFATLGLSHFLPGGGAESSASAVEKLYVVVTGEITIITDTGETVLGPMDNCRLAPGQRRSILNRSNLPASMLVILPAG